MAKGDSKEFIEYKISALKGAIAYLNRGDSMDDWSYALKLGPQYPRNDESYRAAKELHRYVNDGLEPSVNYFWWLKQHRPEEKRSLKECMIAWAEWMISCLREDLDAYWEHMRAVEEEERRRKNWNHVTRSENPPPPPREERTVIIRLG